MSTIHNLIAPIVLAMAVSHGAAQSHFPWTSPSVLSGGASRSSANGYTFAHTLGEAIVGDSNGGDYSLHAGFVAADSITDQAPDLKLTSAVSTIILTENIARDWTINVSNSGSAAATAVKVYFELPSGLRATAAMGSSAGSCTVSSSNVTCSVANLAGNASFQVQLTLVANPLPETANEFYDLGDLTIRATTDETESIPADNTLALPVIVWLRLDWGDARGGFPVTQSENGARHRYWPGYRLGAQWDSEGTGVHSPLGNWDDGQQADDEDGVMFLGAIVAGVPASVIVNCSFAGFLDAWADFNNDGDWNDPGEQLFASQPLIPGNNPLSLFVPVGAVPGSVTTRWRASTTRGLSFTGYGGKGEVEDHPMLVQTAPRPALKHVGGVWTIAFRTEAQANYVVEYTDSLTAPRWELLVRLVGSGSPVAVNDSTTSPMRFYCVRIE